jgi:hypothetical protein
VPVVLDVPPVPIVPPLLDVLPVPVVAPVSLDAWVVVPPVPPTEVAPWTVVQLVCSATSVAAPTMPRMRAAKRERKRRGSCMVVPQGKRWPHGITTAARSG